MPIRGNMLMYTSIFIPIVRSDLPSPIFDDQNNLYNGVPFPV